MMMMIMMVTITVITFLCTTLLFVKCNWGCQILKLKETCLQSFTTRKLNLHCKICSTSIKNLHCSCT